MKRPDLILSADWHLRLDTPKCRTDDYVKAEIKALKFLHDLYNKYECPIVVAGDMFNQWKTAPELLRFAMESIPSEVMTIPGQHDLPEHNMNQFFKSGLAVIRMTETDVITDSEPRYLAETNHPLTIHAFPFGSKLQGCMKRSDDTTKHIAICHVMTYTKKPWPGIKTDNALHLLKRMAGYDLIITGDNHEPFVVEHEGRLLVNPGSLFRMEADQIDHKPRVYLWYAKTNTVKPVFLPIEQGVVSREHIEVTEKHDKRLEVFVKRLHDDWEVGLSFEKNMKKFFSKNKVHPKLKQLVWEMMA